MSMGTPWAAFFFCLLVNISTLISGTMENSPIPIQFGISESKIVHEIPEKDRDFAFLIPGKLSTYIYNNEVDYYADYQRAYYAVTCKKGGWDCMRHYEILANGCIPYFLNLDACDADTMPFLPRDLIKEAMNLKGVSYLHIDHSQFDHVRYYEILQELLDHTRRYMTTKAIASYVLDQMNYIPDGPILYLSCENSPDYMRDAVLLGLKELYQDKIIDYPKITFLYNSYTKDPGQLYGKGFSYSKILDDIPVDRENLSERIMKREFVLIIYGSVHRGLPYHDLVLSSYPSEKIAYICGEDFHRCWYVNFPNLFLRESEAK